MIGTRSLVKFHQSFGSIYKPCI